MQAILLVVGKHAAYPFGLLLGHPDRQLDEPVRPALVRQPLLCFPQLRFAILGYHGGNGNRLALIHQQGPAPCRLSANLTAGEPERF